MPSTLPEPHHIIQRAICVQVWYTSLMIVNTIPCSYNGQFPQKDAPSEIFIILHRMDEYNCHDSCLRLRMDHVLYFIFFVVSKRWLFSLEAIRCVLKDLWRRGANAKKNVYQSTAFKWWRGLQWTGTQQLYQGMQQSGVSR